MVRVLKIKSRIVERLISKSDRIDVFVMVRFVVVMFGWFWDWLRLVLCVFGRVCMRVGIVLCERVLMVISGKNY